MKLVWNLLLTIATVAVSILLSLLMFVVLYYVAISSSWLLGVDSPITSLLIVSSFVFALVISYSILKTFTKIKFIRMINYTIIYWFVHPLIVRPSKAIIYLLSSRETKVDYLSKINDSPTIVKNKELNNAKHRLNYLNFINQSMITNNKVLYSINLKQTVIKESFPEQNLIFDSVYKVNLDEVETIEDNFETRRKFLKEDKANFKYKKENRNVLLTTIFLLFLSLTLISTIVLVAASTFVATPGVLITPAFVMLTSFLISLMTFSMFEYSSIEESTMIVNKKGMEKLKQGILYDISNIVKLHDSLNGLIGSNYEAVNEFINSTDKKDGIKEMYESYVGRFGTVTISQAEEEFETSGIKNDQYIKEKEAARIRKEAEIKRKEIKKEGRKNG